MTPEARKAFLEAAQVCDNVANIAQEHHNYSIMYLADKLSLYLRLEAIDAKTTVELHEKADGEADGAAQ